MLLTCLILASCVVSGLQDSVAQDPEAAPGGRSIYLGREIATTMHWKGAPWLLRETRENEENGEQLRGWLDVSPGTFVCDLGCGNGYHTLPLARSVGAKGRVFAVDLQPEMLELLAERATEEELSNVVTIEATVDDSMLPPDSTDLVLMVDVYHELSHPVRVLASISRALRKDGRIVLVEFRTEDRAVPIRLRHKMTKAQMIREMAANGFVLVDETDSLPWQHVMAFGEAPSVGARLEPRAFVDGFLAAAAKLDPRIVWPFLAPQVDCGAGGSMTSKELAVSIAESMRGTGAPIPAGTRAELSGRADGKIVVDLFVPDGGLIEKERSQVLMGQDEEMRWQVEAWRPRASMASLGLTAMHTGLGQLEPQAAANLLAELGFSGVSCALGDASAFRAACEPLGLDVVSAYAILDLGAPLEPQLRAIETEMSALSGGPGSIWLAVRASGESLERDALDESALEALSRLDKFAVTSGVEIALYPHTGYHLATTEQAVQLAKRVDSTRVGVCFNLCHYLMRDEAPPLEPLLESALPQLLSVTVSGADVGGKSWRKLIQPLDAGDYDLEALLSVLHRGEYPGSVGLQGFGIGGPPKEHLTRSIDAWRAATIPK